MPHGGHIYAKAYHMENDTMCTYTQFDHSLPHCKCVLRCCSEFPYINIPDQETNKKHEEKTPSIRFHIYHIIGQVHPGLRVRSDTLVSFMIGSSVQIGLSKA